MSKPAEATTRLSPALTVRALFWCPKSLYLPPVFNTLVLFNVGPDTHHFVTEVSPYAQGKRLAIKGWGTGRQDRPQAGPERSEGGPTSIERPIETYWAVSRAAPSKIETRRHWGGVQG
jgi:2OG-Fe(II) oxygenase superfamily